MYCEKKFYGPLVVSFNSTESPYILQDFTSSDLERLTELNSNYKRKSPKPISERELKPLVHWETEDDEFLKRDSMTLELLKENLQKQNFYQFRFKTQECPGLGIDHDYRDCLYYHSDKDRR